MYTNTVELPAVSVVVVFAPRNLPAARESTSLQFDAAVVTLEATARPVGIRKRGHALVVA
jgi:hypothetical protein